jgi:hypothetical protein
MGSRGLADSRSVGNILHLLPAVPHLPHQVARCLRPFLPRGSDVCPGQRPNNWGSVLIGCDLNGFARRGVPLSTMRMRGVSLKLWRMHRRAQEADCRAAIHAQAQGGTRQRRSVKTPGNYAGAEIPGCSNE